jgi:threonine/homoserine/homoserine lactone efflux protein
MTSFMKVQFMPLDLWFAFAAASCALLLIPGPTVLLVLSYALSKGRSVALASAGSVALGDFIAMSASLAGLGALVATSAAMFTSLKWIGAAYLLWLGVRLLRSAPSAGLEAMATEHDVTPRSVFTHAAGVTALNPKSIAFFIAFVPQFLQMHSPLLPQFVILVSTFVALAALNTLAYALLADKLRQTVRTPAVLAGLTRIGGATLVGMGLFTALLRRPV